MRTSAALLETANTGWEADPFSTEFGDTAGAVIAHPDDEYYLAHAIQRWNQLALIRKVSRMKVFVATNGEASTRGDISKRPGQVITSLGRLGVAKKDVIFGNRPDKQLPTDDELKEEVGKFIAGLDAVFTLGENTGGHGDHDETHRAVVETVEPGTDIWVFNNKLDSGIWVRGNPAVKLEVLGIHDGQFSARRWDGASTPDGTLFNGFVLDDYTLGHVNGELGKFLRHERYEQITL